MKVLNRLLPIDARLIKEILYPAELCVDVIITSPPYWNLKNYRASNQIGYGQTRDEYLADINKILRDCFNITKPTGSLWLIVDTYRDKGELQLLPLEMAERAHKAGWKLREIIVWDKQYNVPWHSKGQLRNISEFILFLTKSNDYKYYIDRIKNLDEISKWWVDFPERFNPKGKTPTNIWSIPMRPRGTWRKPSKLNHYCSFPTALVARIIELTTDSGDLVMDPFAGSGVVLAQAEVMGRQYIGFEVNKEYVQMFEETVKKEVATDWENMRAWRKSQADAKDGFEQTIMKLRALKYTRQVTRPFSEVLKLEQQDQIRAILCIASIPNEYQRGCPFEVKILIMVDQLLPELQEAFETVKIRASQPPLTQYEIYPDIEITTYSDLKCHAGFINRKLYMYPNYRPHKYIANGSLQKWFEGKKMKELSKHQKIPMLANFAVDVAWVLEK